MSDPDRQAFIPSKPSNRPPSRKHTAPRGSWTITGWDVALVVTGFGLLILLWVLS